MKLRFTTLTHSLNPRSPAGGAKGTNKLLPFRLVLGQPRHLVARLSSCFHLVLDGPPPSAEWSATVPLPRGRPRQRLERMPAFLHAKDMAKPHPPSSLHLQNDVVHPCAPSDLLIAHLFLPPDFQYSP